MNLNGSFKITPSTRRGKSPSIEELYSIMPKIGDNPIEVNHEVASFYKTILSGEIPESVPELLTNRNLWGTTMSSLIPGLIWQALHAAGYFTVATKRFARAFKEVVKDGIVLDPLAGAGFLAKSLREAGVKTIISDDNSWVSSGNFEKLDAVDSLIKYGDKITHLVIAWPDFRDDIDYRLLMKKRELFPDVKIITIGETRGGATGSDKFWNSIKVINNQEARTLLSSYQSFIDLNDHPIICE